MHSHSPGYGGFGGHQQRIYPPHGMPPPGMMRPPHQQGAPHHGLPPNARPGDWMCRACNNHNYADKTACNRCKVPKDVYIAATGMRVGDWLCPACSNHNFKDKVLCNKCAGPRPATIPLLGVGHGMGGGSSHGHEIRPGDWMCRHCNNHNYADKTACNRCRTPIAAALGSNGSMSAAGWPAGPAVTKRLKPTPIDSDPTKVQFELRYFPVCAKGLGPALVAEHSGLRWAGNATLGFNVNTDWATMKPQAPFGQLPVLTVPAATAWASSPYARSGDEACANIGQTTAIINYIGKTAGTEGDTAESFATSQQLLAEGEDLYLLGTKSLPTVYKRLSDPASGIITSKGTASDYATFWATILPAHLARLNRLCRGGSFQPPSRTAAQYLPGELYLWNVLYQFHMIDPSVLSSHKDLNEWFERVRNEPATQRVTSGSSPMGELRQRSSPMGELRLYFLAADSPEICLLADERD